jgi:hypothetical protein
LLVLLCAFVAAADGHFAFARSCMCQTLVLASVREIVCKGTKNGDYKAAKKILFLWLLSFFSV